MKPSGAGGPASPWNYQRKTLVVLGLTAIALGALAYYRKMRHTAEISQPVKVIEPATLTGDLASFRSKLDQQLACGPLSNELYLLDTPQGPVHIRILVRDQHGLKLKPQPGFAGFHGTGIAVAISGPAAPDMEALIRELATNHRLRVQAWLPSQHWVDFLASY